MVSTDIKSLTLRVGEAKPKDVGRGIARIDPRDMERLDSQVGDVIQIEASEGRLPKSCRPIPKTGESP